MRAALALVLVLAASSAGCLSAVGPTESPAETPTSVEFAAEGTDCGENRWVSFYGLDEPSLWNTSAVAVGYDLPANASFLLVAYVDGAVRGVSYENNTLDHGITVDGSQIALNESLSGTHVVQVLMYDDVNGNGAFDAGVDRPCLSDGEVVDAGPKRIDFGRFD